MGQKTKIKCLGRYRPVLFLFMAKARLANCFLPLVSKAVTTVRRSPDSKTRVNGIRGFRLWFENEFPESVVTINGDTSEDTFDHVLLDMNHMIHKVLRRSRSEEHAVRSLMSELDAVLNMVIPTKSLVLAIDGAPPAAKLATQRSRRYGTLLRTQWKLDHFDKLRISKKHRARKLRAYHSEIQSLQITPGTEFQELMEKTLLYWAWQRLQYKRGKFRDVRIYISPSTVAGEGEVKILEWILQKPRQGQSVAILGGDSDLLLEGLIIPPYWTHNIFVIQADTNRKYFSVSLWETTRKLHSWLPSGAPPEQVLQLRTDLVILMILNGNDYLPRLRGTKGFSNLCQIYQRLVREEYSSTAGRKRARNTKSKDTVGLLNPDTLEFRIDFCLRFFDEVLKAITSLRNLPSSWVEESIDREQTPVSKLNNLVDAGFIPQPSKYHVIMNDQPSNAAEDTVDDDDEDARDADDEVTMEGSDESETGVSSNEILVRLTLGDPTSDDFFQYEVTHDANQPLKTAKNKLALMALDDFFGTDLASSESEEDYDSLMEMAGAPSRGYSWEVVKTSRPGSVEKYLSGLLWTIKTYQDGICADYNFSYGRLRSPNIGDMIDYFQKIKSEGGSIGSQTLLGDTFSPPVSAGLSCLAALPAQVKHLIPEPHRWIPDDIVEALFAECMNQEDNGFDMKRFEALCEEEIQKIRIERGESAASEQSNADSSHPSHGRRILSGDHWWTVLARTPEPLPHPFDPPSPPLENFSDLASNPRIRVSRSFSIDAPRSRATWGNKSKTKTNEGKPQKRKESDDINYLSFGKLLVRGKGNNGNENRNLLDIPYKIDYPKERQKQSQRKRTETLVDSVPPGEVPDILGRLQEFQKVMPPAEPVANVEGHTALYILSQLHSLDMVGPIEFNITSPSPSAYAAWNPEHYELYQLRIKPSNFEASNVLNRTLEFDQDRNAYHQSRQALKQHLADLALSDLLGPGIEWKTLTLADLRWELNQRIVSNSRNGQGGGKDAGNDGSLHGNA